MFWYGMIIHPFYQECLICVLENFVRIRIGLRMAIPVPENLVEYLRSTADDKKKLFPAGHFDDMVTELCLYRANNLSGIVFEGNFLKLRYHLTFTKPTEVSPILPGGAG
jgi:hypothetical protein